MEEPRYRGPAYETARLKLARIRVEGRESRERADRYVAQVSAEALGVARVALWQLRDGQRQLAVQCIHSGTGTAPQEQLFRTERCGHLLASLQERRLVVVEGKADLERLGDLNA